MKMKWIIGFWIACAAFTVQINAQNFWNEYPRLNLKEPNSSIRFVSLQGMYNFGCDGLHNDFLQKMYTGGYLDSAYIENSAASLLPTNRFGVTTTAGIMFAFDASDTNTNIISLGLLRRNNISARFSDDAFRLAFQGNSRYKGLEADIGGTRLRSMSWSQLKFGYYSPKANGGIEFNFSVLVGHHYNEANISYGKLFTDSQGTFIDASVAADYWSSDTGNVSAFALNGFGTSVDVTWYRFWQSNSNMKLVRIDFMDFGFINWNSKTIHRTADTTFRYNGIDVTQFFVDPAYEAQLPEESDFIKDDTSDFHRSVFLPAIIRATYIQSFMSGRLRMKVSAAMPFWSEALPYGALTASWKFKYKFETSAGIAYGGYAGIQVPVKIDLLMLKQTSFEIGTTNVLGFIDPASFTGGGAYTKLTYCF